MRPRLLQGGSELYDAAAARPRGREALRRGRASVRRGPIGLDPQVRGLQESQIGVFVDGTRTFAAGPARMDSDLAHVSPRAVERMRVVKGPYALTWGAGALSAIRMETFRPGFGSGRLRFDGRAGLAYGDNAASSDGYAGLWGSDERVRFQALLQGRAGEDYEDGDGETVPGDYESADARWSVGLQLGERGLVEYVGGYQQQQDVDYPGRLLDADFFYTRSHALDFSWSGGGLDELYAQAYVNRKDHRMNNDEKPTALPNPGRIPPFGIDVVLPTESNTAGGKLSARGALGDLGWMAGTDFYVVEQTATRSIFRRDSGARVFRDVVWPDAEIEDLGAYLQLSRQSAAFTVAGTLRADRVDATAGEVSDFFRDNTTGDLDQSETQLSAALSGRFRLAEAWSLSAGIGRAVRAANVLERYSDRFPSTRFQIAAEFVGNPGVDPEESLQADLGVEYRSADLLFQFDGYYRTIDDHITVMPDPSLPKRLPLSPDVVFRYVNGAEARFYGGEARLQHRASDLLQWRATVSYVRGEDTEFDEPAFGLPPLTGRLGLRLSPGTAYWVDVNLTLVAEQDRVATARLEQPTPGYATVDLLASFEPSPKWRLNAGIENVGDRQYVNHLNSANPFTRQRIAEEGVNVHASVEYRF